MGTPLGPKYIPYTYMDPFGPTSCSVTDLGWQHLSSLHVTGMRLAHRNAESGNLHRRFYVVCTQ